MLIGVWFLILNGALCTRGPLTKKKLQHNENVRRILDPDIELPLLLTPLINEAKYEDAKERASVISDEMGIGIKTYAGFLTVDQNLNSNLWFWYFPVSPKPVDSTPLIIWLQDGIGVSSLYGVLNEIGPLEIDNNGDQPFNFNIKDFSWGKQHSLLFIDSPVGAGYSFTEEVSGYATDQDVIGQQLFSALQQFMKLFSELQSVPLVIAGQGYAGKHVTSLAIQIHRHGKNQKPNMNLKALVIGSSLVNPGATLGHSEYAYRTGLIDSRVANHMHALELLAKASLDDDDIGKAHSYYLDILAMLKHAGVPNIHNYLSDEPTKDDLSWSFHLQHKLKKLLHVGNTTFPQYDVVRAKLLPDYMNHTQGWLEELLDHYRILCYSGQLDVLVPYALLEKFYDSLHWSGRSKYHRVKRRAWYHRGKLAGYHKSGGRLTTVLVRGAGYMAPIEQGEHTLALISAFIRGRSLDTDTGQ